MREYGKGVEMRSLGEEGDREGMVESGGAEAICIPYAIIDRSVFRGFGDCGDVYYQPR